jgi:CPA1 family monovalent cation:H+ antiporter
VIIQFLSTFAVWMLADALHLSGIITVVVYAILIARGTASTLPARLRIPSYAVWEVAVFVLNVLAFILVGLQLKPILGRLDHPALLSYGATAAAVCATVIVVRIIWVMGYYVSGVRLSSGPDAPATWRGSALAAWCGMRGIVTLAAALALPEPFPHRDLVLFTAFAVVLGTLVVQGLTLKPLLGLLRLEDDGSVDREVWLARARTSRAALDALATASFDAETGGLLRRKYESRARHAEHVADTGAHDPEDDAAARELLAVRRRAQAAERRVLVDLRARGVIGDDAFHQVEEELDWADLDLDGTERNG